MESTISEKEHQLLLDAIKDHAIFMIDTKGHVSSWNEGAKSLKGYEEHEVVGKHFRMLFLPEDQHGRPEREMKKALHTGKFEEEWWRMRKDGSRFWAHIILQPVFDKDQNHIGYAKITTDRTEQKRINELNAFLMNETTGYAIFLLDKEGNIAKWSKAAESITGFSEQEVTGASLAIIYLQDGSPDLDSVVRTQLSKALDDRYEDEHWSVRKNGSHFWAHYVISPLHNKDGYVVMIRDLTEKRALEQASKANIALTASNKELERFANVASHDLKEPVRKISIFCHMLQAENPKQENLLTKITNACSRMSNLIDDILEYSFLARKKQVVQQDLNVILQHALGSLEEQIRDKGAIIRYKPLPQASVIPYQMEQLFQNLISNAIKFCCQDEQPPTVTIDGDIVAKETLPLPLLGNLTHADHYLQIKVQDNGFGFEQEHSSGIFDLFSRLHNRTEFEGTGVGLAICKRVAESHGGNIQAFSERGKGALFVITLPHQEGENGPEAAEPE